MNTNQWWCCSYFEVPYHGVSPTNIAGHLSLALRNKSERRVQQPHTLKFQEKGGFLTDAHQPLLRGILGIANWQLTFMPCVSSTESAEDSEVARQTLLGALRRTEPGFQHLWVSGFPGSIPFATIDYLLAVDRHERVYKFDPITSMWSASLDGARPAPTARIFRDSSDIPHSPTRLLIFTTALEVYAFRLCTLGFSLNIPEGRGKDETKRILRQFLSLLTARVHYVRTASGIQLAETYLAQLPLTNLEKNRTNAPQSKLPAPSLNPFDLSLSVPMNNNTDQTVPINNYPVHPIERAERSWFHLRDDHEWIANPEFAYCRTYPLLVPSIRFHRPLIEMRQYFEGYRFPALSYCHRTGIGTTDGNIPNDLSGKQRSKPGENYIYVRLLRSGQFTSSVPLHSFLNSYITRPIIGSVRSRRPQPIRVIEIRLHETDFDIIRASSDSFLPLNSQISGESSGLINQLCLDDSVSLSSSSSFKSASRTSWFVPLSMGPPDTVDTNSFTPNTSVRRNNAKSGFVHPNSLGSEFSWCAPRAQVVYKAWLRLGSLIRLSQIHVPTSETAPADVDGVFLLPRRSIGSISMLDIPIAEQTNSVRNRSPMWLDEAYQQNESMSASQTFLHCFLGRDRTESQTDSSPLRAWRLSIGNLSRNTRLNGTDVETDTASLLGGAKPRLSLRTSLGSLAMQRAVHRSDWFAHLLNTKWLDLVLFALKQATQLTNLITSFSPSANGCSTIDNDSVVDKQYDDTVLVLTGPGSGRTWQPLLTSLTQLMLSPSTRTLAGFEDLIEREWVRYGYPFAPDPPDWHDSAVTDDYDAGATFALFLDCVHQLLDQFPTYFAFTEDYLVALLDCALSRGGGLPPFAIEFACSCDAARCVSSKGVSKSHVHSQSNFLFNHKALRSFRDWTSMYTLDGCRLFANWCYWWMTQSDPLSKSHTMQLNGETVPIAGSSQFPDLLLPLTSPASYIRVWIHGWLRWNRSLRLCNGGGYAFHAAFYRRLLTRDPPNDDTPKAVPFLHPTTSATPYTGWLSDEAILHAESQATCDTSLTHWITYSFISELVKLAKAWEKSPSLSAPRDRNDSET